MLPFLKVLNDEREYSIREMTNILEEEFQLTEKERNLLKNDSFTTIFSARVGWARTCLMKAGLIDFPTSGKSKINNHGQKVILEGLKEINNNYLLKFDSFRKFYMEKFNLNSSSNNTFDEIPGETVDKSYEIIKKTLASEFKRNHFIKG